MATSNVYLILSEPMFQGRSALASDGSEDHLVATAYGTNAANRPGSIEVLDFSFSVEQIGSEPSGRPRSIESIARSKFVFKKAVDSRSPKLFRYCCEGTYIAKAECQIYGPTNTPYLTYHMAHVHIASYAPSGGEELPTETIGLTFGEMAVKFDNSGIGEGKHGNTRTGSVVTKWSWIFDIPGMDLVAGASSLEGESL